MDVMIDIETLDTSASSVILTVGAVKFQPDQPNIQPHALTEWRLDLEHQLDSGRTTSDDTLAWWSRQDPHIRQQAFDENDRISIAEFMAQLNKYVNGCEAIWCQGPQFDMVILEHLYDQMSHHFNWHYWQIRDSRTLFKLMPSDPRQKIQQHAHNAAQDAYWQAVCVQNCYSALGLEKSS